VHCSVQVLGDCSVWLMWQGSALSLTEDSLCAAAAREARQCSNVKVSGCSRRSRLEGREGTFVCTHTCLDGSMLPFGARLGVCLIARALLVIAPIGVVGAA
jgi:hypothetical protein